MKISTGMLSGEKIESINSSHIQQTSTLTRNSVFKVLNRCTFSHVLDLFAGTGSYGLESFSNGAKDIVFVEYDKRAVEVIEKNCGLIGLNPHIFHLDYQRYLNQLENENFDLVFINPPKYITQYEQIVEKLIKYTSNDAIIVCDAEEYYDFPFTINKFFLLDKIELHNKQIAIYKKDKHSIGDL